MRYNAFEDLPIWRDALRLTKIIYDVSARLPWSRDYGLRDQIRRAMISVTANIVEGFEKNNNNEFSRYLRISKGSIGEVRNHLYVALSVEYIGKEDFEKMNNELKRIAQQIGGFIVYLQRYKQSKIGNVQYVIEK